MALSRRELFSRLGLVRVVDPLTDQAYRAMEQSIWEDNLENSPHGHPWHTSFHASSFPGDDKKACARKAIYGLMDIPASAPIEPKLRAQGDAGKDIELQVVRRWEQAGILLTAGAGESIQTGFVDAEHWLTGNTDAIIHPPDWNRGHVVELKSKAEEVIKQMQLAGRSFDAAHRHQVMTYIGFGHEVSKDRWPDLDPIRDGTLYYVSRDNPRNTMEFIFEYSPEFMRLGREKLKEWQQHFLDGTLPERPKDWKWTEQPCKWCPLKKHVCKPDHRAGVSTIVDSGAIGYAKEIRPTYDYDQTRKAVLDRWQR